MDAELETISERALPVGTRVEVRNRYCAAWSRGFEVVAVADGRYRLRRLSDGAVLPAEFAHHDVRRPDQELTQSDAVLVPHW